MRSIISYADPLERRDAAGKLTKPAHAGQIHQAHNSIYAGRASAQYLWLTHTGQVLSRRTLNKIAGQDRGHAYTTRQLLAAGAPPRVPFEEPAAWLERALPLVATRVRHPGNHGFAFGLDDDSKRQVLIVNDGGRAYPRVGDRGIKKSPWCESTRGD